MSNNWKISWKLPLLYYMILTDKYMIYPSRTSFSTTLAPFGENIKSDSLKILYNVQMLDHVELKDLIMNPFHDGAFRDFAQVSITKYTLYAFICTI